MGLTPFYNIRARERYSFNNQSGENKLNAQNKLGIGSIIGCGFEAELTKRIFFELGLRYQYDFTPAFKGPNDEYNGNFRTVSLMVGVRYKFSINKKSS